MCSLRSFALLALLAFGVTAEAQVSCTNLFAGGTDAGTTGYTSTSFTPSNNVLLVALHFQLAASANPGLDGSDITISDSLGTLTWTSRAATPLITAWNVALRAHTAPVTTGAAMTVTVGNGAITAERIRVEVYECTGYDTGSPIGGTAANITTGSGAGSLTLSSTPASGSWVFAATMSVLNSGSGTADPATGWTELFDTAKSGWGFNQSQRRTGSTSDSVNWDDICNCGSPLGSAAMLAVEIKAAAGGGSAVPVILQQQAANDFPIPRLIANAR